MTATCAYLVFSLALVNDPRSPPGIYWEQIWLLSLLVVLGLVLWVSDGTVNRYFVVGAVLGAVLIIPGAFYAMGLDAPLGALWLELFYSALGALLIGSIGLIFQRRFWGWIGLMIGIGFAIHAFS